MNYIKNNYKNWIILLSGLIVLSFGASIIIVTEFGGDSITVFSGGLSNILKIDYGYAYIIGNFFFLLFMFLFHRRQIGIGTILSTFLIGLLINLFSNTLPFEKIDNTVFNFLFSLTGLMIAAIGLSLYIYSNTGLGPFEAFVDFFSEKFKIKFGYIKIIIDALLFILGFLMGGIFGLTSVISVIVLGPLIDLFGLLFKKTNIIKETA